MHNKNLLSYMAIITILLGEFCFVIGQHTHCYIYYEMALLFAFIIIFMGIYGKYDFSVKTMVLKKLLANAIAPKRISALYLIFFIVHLTWISDSLLNLSFPSAYPCWQEIVMSVFVSILGFYSLIVFFPTEILNNDSGKPRLFVSGISTLALPRDNDYNLLNLLPLVRALKFKDTVDNESGHNDDNTFLLLRTNQLLVENDININIYDKRESLSWEKLQAVWSFLEKKAILNKVEAKQEDIDWINKIFEKVQTLTNKRNHLRGEEIIEENKEEYKQDIKGFIYKDGSQNNFDKILKYIIRILVKNEFQNEYFNNLVLNYDEENNNLKIVLTEGCDYNNFESCQHVLQESLQSFKDDKYNIIFNITPGTSIIGALMMLFGVDPTKKVCFYAQDGSNEIININKDYSVLNNIFKEVLAKTEDDKNP